MAQVRFTTRGLLVSATVFCVCLAVAASSAPLVIELGALLLLVSLCLSIAGSFLSRGPTKAFCVGFAVFAVAPILMPANGVLMAASNWLASLRPIGLGTQVSAQWTNGRFYEARITDVLDDGSYEVTWLDGSSPSVVTLAQITSPRNLEIGAGISIGFRLCLAYLGALVSVALFGDALAGAARAPALAATAFPGEPSRREVS